MTFSKRRKINVLLMLFGCLGLFQLSRLYETPWYRVQIGSGWTLFILLVVLLCYRIRKKFVLLPIGNASSWLQVHIYVGLLALIVFLRHLSYRLPNGYFEAVLAILFVATAVSGIIGLLISRLIPKYLTRRGEDVIYERIPLFTHQLRLRAEQLIVDCTAQTQSTALADYYINYLADYFYSAKMTLPHALGSMNYLYFMHIRHDNFCRYLNEKEKAFAAQLFELVEKKYDLDFHFTQQGLLKNWLFIHLPMSYLLFLAVLLHIMLIYAFSGAL